MTFRRPLVALVAVLVAATFLTVLRTASAQLRSPVVRLPEASRRPKAPEFPAKFEWLNNDQPLQIHGNLKGHVIVLDFFTYCCINCMHVLPDLEYVEHKYAGKPLAVVGVHSAKFKTEEDAKNIHQAIQRYRIAHPVIVDENHAIWDEFNTRAWPTFWVIDSAGRLVGRLSGEGNREALDDVIFQLLEEGKRDGTLAEKPIAFKPTLLDRPKSELAYPGKVAVDAKNKRLVIADSNHDRVIVTDTAGKVLHVIGSGNRGFKDGSFAEAEFHDPQGLAVEGDTIYLADTKNHSLRRLDLATKTVTTIAGTGKQDHDRVGGGKGTSQPLASPWDLALDGQRLLIAMAGTHQIWEHDLKTGVSKAWSGSGRENIVDGPADDAQLAQPSGLAIHDGYLYFADSEVSAVRRASLQDGTVETLIGTGLFDFGLRDGDWSAALLQHCLGVAAWNGSILVADTYNDAVRRIDLKNKTIETIKLDGDKIDEPAGIAVLDGVAYIADTNHHRIVRLDPATGKIEAIKITVP